jgi:hypothetical protein
LRDDGVTKLPGLLHDYRFFSGRGHKSMSRRCGATCTAKSLSIQHIQCGRSTRNRWNCPSDPKLTCFVGCAP